MNPGELSAEIVRNVAHGTYRRRLDRDADREVFDALPPEKQLYRTRAYEPTVRAVMLELGWSEPPHPKSKSKEIEP